jgi:hypothetical protein
MKVGPLVWGSLSMGMGNLTPKGPNVRTADKPVLGSVT